MSTASSINISSPTMPICETPLMSPTKGRAPVPQTQAVTIASPFGELPDAMSPFALPVRMGVPLAIIIFDG
jgi:hypothetical protein